MKPKLLLVAAGRRVSFIEKMQEYFSVCTIENEINTPSSKVADKTVILKDDKEIEEFLAENKTPFFVLNDRLAYQLANLNFYMGPPRNVARICYDKVEFANYFKNNPLLKEYYPHPSNGHEVIYKARFGSGSKGIFRSGLYSLQDENDINLTNQTYVAQEKLKAPEYSVDCLFYEGEAIELLVRSRDRVGDGEVIDSTIIEKQNCKYIRQAVNNIGIHMNYSGPACFQFMEDNNGIPKIIEINARFGGGCLLSLTASPTFMNNLLIYYNNVLEDCEAFSFIKYDGSLKCIKMRRVYREFYF